MATRFVPNPDFRRELTAALPFRRGMGEITFKVADSIEVAALPYRDTGNFMRRIQPHYKGGNFYVETERSFSHILEFGSVNNSPQRNVLRGVRAAGLRYEDTGPEQAD